MMTLTKDLEKLPQNMKENKLAKLLPDFLPSVLEERNLLAQVFCVDVNVAKLRMMIPR